MTAPQLVPSEEVQSPRRRRTPPVAIRNVAPIETLAPLVAYSFALLIPMVAWIATMVFALYIKNLVFIFFWPAVIFVAVLGGFGPAFVAALWSSVLAANFIVPPLRGLSPGSPPELARFIGFFATSLFVGLLTHTLQDERRRAGEAARENARLARQLEQQAMALERVEQERRNCDVGLNEAKLAATARGIAVAAGRAGTIERGIGRAHGRSRNR